MLDPPTLLGGGRGNGPWANNFDPLFGQLPTVTTRSGTLRILTPILVGKFSKFTPPPITLRLATSLVPSTVEGHAP